jgi:hypothetical protein
MTSPAVTRDEEYCLKTCSPQQYASERQGDFLELALDKSNKEEEENWIKDSFLPSRYQDACFRNVHVQLDLIGLLFKAIQKRKYGERES